MKRKLEFKLVIYFGKILNLWRHYSFFLYTLWGIHLPLAAALR